jgi:tellurite resistance protein
MDQDDRVLSDRRKALEEAFFQKQEAKLKDKRRVAQERDAACRDLRSAFPHATQDALDRFLDQGLDVEAVSALALVPLVMVAWADGTVGDAERKAVDALARENGLDPGGRPYTLLTGWLVEQPSPSLIELWSHYVQAVCKGLSTEARERLRDRVLGLARSVAKAMGGFLGIGKISDAEEAVLRRIEQAFEV